MAITVTVPGSLPGRLGNKEVDWEGDDIRIMAFTSSATFVQDTTDFLNDVRAAEVTGTNWAANGVALTGLTSVYTAGTNTHAFDAADVDVATVTLANVRAFALVDYETAVDATSPILLWVDLGEDVDWTAQPVQIAWPAAGILRQTVP
jgi:hypothetical protein